MFIRRKIRKFLEILLYKKRTTASSAFNCKSFLFS